MRIVTGLETAKEQVKNNQVTKINVMRYIQDGIDYIEYLEKEKELLENETVVFKGDIGRLNKKGGNKNGL